MAYSGLGAGTQADPYQITTVSQFKEMDNASYAGVYFLLMNDLDFIAEESVVITNFYCKFDGGNHALTNLPIAGYVFRPASGSSIINVAAIFIGDSRYTNLGVNPGFISNHSSFPTLSDFILSNVRVTNLNTDPAVLMGFANNITFGNTCRFDGLTIEGRFQSLIYSFFGEATNVHVLNTAPWYCPLFTTLQGTAVINGLHYTKPLTASVNHATLVARTIMSGAVIEKVYLNAGKTTTNYPNLIAESIAGSGAYTIKDVHIKCNYINCSPTWMDSAALLLFGTSFAVSETRLFSNIWFEGNVNNLTYPGGTKLFDKNGRAIYCYYDIEEFTTTTYSLNAAYQTGLNDSESSLETSYNGFDFVNVWEIDQNRAVLKGLSNSTFNIAMAGANITSYERLSANSVKIDFLLSADQTFGVELKDKEGNVVYDSTIENDTATIPLSLNKDELYDVSVYVISGEVAEYVLKSTYQHFYLDSAVTVDEYPAIQLASLNDGATKGIYIHGSVLVGQYLYGSARNLSYPTENGCIVKVPVSDVSAFEIVPIIGVNGQITCEMDSLVHINSYLYTLAQLNNIGGPARLVKYSLADDTYQTYYINAGDGAGFPSCTDGTYLYVYVGWGRISKIDVSLLTGAAQFNEDYIDVSVANLSYVNHFGACSPHTMVVDEEYLYVGFGTGTRTTEYEVQKVRKADMTLVSYAAVPKMTDDMCQTGTHLFIGVEPLNAKPETYGTDMGVCAIRKSDMNVTVLPKLHKTDTIGTQSYASLIFGNYLIDLKTNGYIYALDISQPDEWSLGENVGARTLKAYNILQPSGGSDIVGAINEVFLHECGIFTGFVWGTTSQVVSFDLTGLDYFAKPTVATVEPTIVGDNDVSLAGFITNTGGKTVTAVGIILGQAADLSDGVTYPVTPVTTEFEKAFNDLAYGTYYFRTYATNAEGTGYGEIKSFTLEIPYTEPGQPTDLDKSIQAEITIVWTAPIDDGGTPVTGYKIERKASDGDWAVIVADTGSTATTYTETLPQGAYQYRVSAITAYATSQPSATLDVNAVVGGVGKYRIFLGSTEITTVE